MPNWCFYNVRFTGDKKDVMKLHQKIQECTSKDFLENGFGHNWLGNVVIGTGICKPEDINTKDVPHCRGAIDDVCYEEGDNELTVYAHSAWDPHVKMWVEVVKKLKLDLEIVYDAEEASVGLYWTNDISYYQKEIYIVDCFYEDDTPIEAIERYEDMDCHYEVDRNELTDFLNDILGEKEDDLDVLLNKFYESDLSDGFSINACEFVPLDHPDLD